MLSSCLFVNGVDEADRQFVWENGMAHAIGVHTRVKDKSLVEHGVSEEPGSSCHHRGVAH